MVTQTQLIDELESTSNFTDRQLLLKALWKLELEQSQAASSVEICQSKIETRDDR